MYITHYILALPRSLSQEMKTATQKLSHHSSTAALFSMTQNWKQPTCSSTAEWTNKANCTKDYCSATERNTVMIQGAAWRSLKNITLVKEARCQRPHPV